MPMTVLTARPDEVEAVAALSDMIDEAGKPCLAYTHLYKTYVRI